MTVDSSYTTAAECGGAPGDETFSKSSSSSAATAAAAFVVIVVERNAVSSLDDGDAMVESTKTPESPIKEEDAAVVGVVAAAVFVGDCLTGCEALMMRRRPPPPPLDFFWLEFPPKGARSEEGVPVVSFLLGVLWGVMVAFVVALSTDFRLSSSCALVSLPMVCC